MFSNRTKSCDKWRSWLLPQLTVFIGLLPWFVWFQQSSNILSPVINLVSIPLIGFFIVPGIFAGTALLLFNSNFIWPLKVVNIILLGWRDVLNMIVPFCEHLVYQGQGINTYFTFILCVIGVIILLLPKGLGWRWFSLPCILLIYLPYSNKIPENAVKITHLDTKKSQVVIIQTKDHVLLYEQGDKTKNVKFNIVQAAILPFLNQNHLKNIDVLIRPYSNDNLLSSVQIKKHLKIKKIFTTKVDNNELQTDCKYPKTWKMEWGYI